MDKQLLTKPYDYFAIYKNGKYLFQKGTNEKIELMSTTKSIIAILFSLLILKNKKIESRLISYYYPTVKIKATIQQLLTHTSGLQDKAITNQIYSSSNIIDYALSLPIKNIGQYSYSNSGYNLLADIYFKETGSTVKEGLLEHFPFLKSSFSWQTDSTGHFYGMSNLQMKPKKLIQLVYYLINTKPKILDLMISKNYSITKRCNKLYSLIIGWLGQYVIFDITNKLVIVRLKISSLKKYYKKGYVTEKEIATIEKKEAEYKLIQNVCSFLKKSTF